MSNIGLDYFLETYEAICNKHTNLTTAEAIEAVKAALYYEIHRDWLAMASKDGRNRDG